MEAAFSLKTILPQELTPALAKLRLDEFNHAMDMQLVDKLGASKLFSIIEHNDLMQVIQTNSTGVAPLRFICDRAVQVGHRQRERRAYVGKQVRLD